MKKIHFKFQVILFLLLLFLISFSNINQLKSQEVSLIAGGDVEWSLMVKEPGIYFGIKDNSKKMREDGWRRLPYIASEKSINHIEEKYDKDLITEKSHHIRSIQYNLEFSSIQERNTYPFQKIATVLKDADIAFINLETPLSDSARWSGAFRTPTSFVGALTYSGIDVVTNANNHAFDAEGEGIIDTKKTLEAAGIGCIGIGVNLENARKPFIVEKNGIKIAVFAYTYGVNPTITDLGFTLPNCSGAMPLDPFIIKEDIQRYRNKVDFVVLSLHWGIENEQEVHPAARQFAYDLLDAGADLIIGHHPHVPRGIEVYKGKPIIYSLGNFIFGHNHTNWGDNILAKIIFTSEGIKQIEILPIAGKDHDLSQPFLLNGERAKNLLQDIQKLSLKLDTKIEIVENRGIVNLF